MSALSSLEWVLRRDRVVTLAALFAVAVLSWAWILAGAGMDMPTMPAAGGAMTGMMPAAWSPAYALLMLVMWMVMMVAMMLPSAAPMILLFATIERRRRQQASPHRATMLFVLGYVLVWAGFSLAATLLQWGLERLALLSPMMTTTSAIFGGAVLMGAGLYQLTPLKHACLRHCRSPLEFISEHWREGPLGMGLRHGLYCVGCCWVLMALLFVGGVMNLAWIAVIALFVLIEKAAPRGDWIGRAGGIGLIAWGGATVANALSSA